MKLVFKFVSIILVIIIYIFAINLLASLINSPDEINSIQNVINEGLNVRIGLSDSISTTVTRTRWYGEIIIHDGIEQLYLFNRIKLPIRIQKYNFVIFHLLFLATLISFIILIFIKSKDLSNSKSNK